PGHGDNQWRGASRNDSVDGTKVANQAGCLLIPAHTLRSKTDVPRFCSTEGLDLSRCGADVLVLRQNHPATFRHLRNPAQIWNRLIIRIEFEIGSYFDSGSSQCTRN